MAEVEIVLSGDEKRLVAAFERAIKADEKFVKKLGDLGADGKKQAEIIGKALTDAIEKPDFKQLITQLRMIGGPEGQHAANALRGHLQETGKAGFKSMSMILEALKEIDPTAREAVDAAIASFGKLDDKQVFQNQLAALRELGPEGKRTADMIEQSFRLAGRNATEEISRIAGELKSMVPEAIQIADTVKSEFAKVARQKVFDEHLAKLRQLGPEAAAVASALKARLRDAADSATQDMAEIVDELAKLDPMAAKVAEEVRQDLKRAANEQAFESVLQKLRQLGPEGRKVAEGLERSLAEAGKIGRESIDSVLGKLKEIDPEAAQLGESLRDAGEEADEGFAGFAENAVLNIAKVAAAWSIVQNTIQSINQYIAEQQKLIEDAKNANLTLAQAQQEAFKNLVGYSKDQQTELLNTIAPAIQMSTQFPDQAQIVNAIGAAGSAGADFATIGPTVAAAAEVTRLNPSQISEYTMAALNISKVAGVTPKEALNILLTSGGEALVKNATDVAETLPTAMLAGTMGMKGNQLDLARQAAALYGLSTDVGGDITGRSSQTNVVGTLEFFNKFFAERPELKDPGDLLGRLKVIQSSPELQKAFVSYGEEGIKVEKQFLPGMRALADPNSPQSKALLAKYENIQAGEVGYQKTVEQSRTATPAIVIASADASEKSTTQMGQIVNTDGAALAKVREITSKAVKQNQSKAAAAFSSLYANTIGWVGPEDQYMGGGLRGTTAIEEAVSGIRELSGLQGSVTDPLKRANLQQSIDNLAKLISDLAGSGAVSPESIASASAMARGPNPDGLYTTQDTRALLSKIADTLDQIRIQNRPNPYSGVIRNNANAASNIEGTVQ